MLIKEYRIPLPMTVEEYRIAQLYMIAKKSREESKGTDSGVEILVNEPYTDGPGPDGRGQFTHKVYHVGSHLPGWFKSLLPKSALTVEEEAWNAYPYTKTRFKCPFVEKFSLEIETYYTPDGGHQDNVFNLTDSEQRSRVVDLIDVVRDQDPGAYECPERDDPTVYVSDKTGRGPLAEDWIEEHWRECRDWPGEQPTASGKSIMCAYKLCKVEFRYWGMQSKIERFIHDVALRKTMLKAHLQAWVWQDEWHGLTMEDIRAIERETAELLKRTMRGEDGEDDAEEEQAGGGQGADGGGGAAAAGGGGSDGGETKMFNSIEYSEQEAPNINIMPKEPATPAAASSVPRRSIVNLTEDEQRRAQQQQLLQQQQQQQPLNRSLSVNAAASIINSVSKPGRLALERIQGGGGRGGVDGGDTTEDDLDEDDEDDDEDEFYDCRENLDDTSSLAKWSSMELTPHEDAAASDLQQQQQHSAPAALRPTLSVADAASGPSSLQHQHLQHQQQQQQHVTFRRAQSMRAQPTQQELAAAVASRNPVIDVADFGVGGASASEASCPTTVLILVAHGGSVLDLDMEGSVRKSDVTTFRGAFESIMRTHYPGLVGHVCIKCVPCPAVCTEALAVLSSLSPYSFDVSPVLLPGVDSATEAAADNSAQEFFFGVSNDHLPVGVIPLLAVSSSAEYASAVDAFTAEANRVFADFLQSEEGLGFCGQVVLVGDSVGSIMGYDALCHSAAVASAANYKRASSDGSINEEPGVGVGEHQTACSTSSLLLPRPPGATGPPGVGTGLPPRGAVSAGVRPAVAANEFFSSVSTEGTSTLSATVAEAAAAQRLDFEVSDFFVFGSPLGIVLAYRKILGRPFDLGRALSVTSSSSSRRSRHPSPNVPSSSSSIPRPAAQQIYNLFHPTDPLACRIEPLLSAQFARAPPINVPRYQKYPMGDGASLSLLEFLQSNSALFASCSAAGEDPGGGGSRPDTPGRHVSTASTGSSSGCGPQQQPAFHRRPSQDSMLSTQLAEHHAAAGNNGSSSSDPEAQSLFRAIGALRPKWWGARRIDYALYCPEGLANFPQNSLPHLFHSSYWESADVIAFILRQLARPDPLHGDGDPNTASSGSVLGGPADLNVFTPNQPREKWIKKRTSVKIRNGAANHRANDVVVREGRPQTLTARFSYGPLDMAALTGEKVDVHVMKEPPAGDWVLVATELTDKHGRITHTLTGRHVMGYGIYPVRMLVRGDHTMLHMYLCVVPPKTESVVFSIDGSFAASVSVTGKDPKVKAGAVDIVRHWQELGYLIVYVTGRPDMQLQRVVSWLAQHNFPHGLVSFADGFTTDPLRHKAEFLKSLISEHEIVLHCAYGSSKDIAVYSGNLGLSPDRIYIVGKASKKQQSQATLLADGYADHLARLTAHGGSRPARGNARMVIPKSNFGLPGQNFGAGLVRRRTVRGSSGGSAKRTTSYPINAGGAGGGAAGAQSVEDNLI